jgi:IclR family transcriptional regulator, KDG regulon repressor
MQNIKSVEKAVDIMSCFTVDTPSLTVTEISFLTGFNQSTVSRILATLEKKKCVERDAPGGKYRLGVKIHQWKNILSQETSLADLARPVMERLRDLCGEEVTLYVPGEGNRICVEAAKSRHGMAKVTQVGKLLPLHCGASGKVLLAYLPEKIRRSIIFGKPLNKFTPSTITDPVELEADLEKIRQDGYAVSLEEREPGTYSVVAPVLDKKGKIVASLTISGPIFRFSEEQREKNIAAALEAAAEISLALGHSEISGEVRA